MEIKIVEPHRKVSRPVTLADYDRVMEAEKAMREWMVAKYSCVGLAHPQIDDEDPLAFFITLQEPFKVICNPKVVVYSSVKTQSKEGCMTFPDKEHIWHDRHVAITVEYEVFKGKKLVKKRKQINGFLAVVYQHEIDHLNAKYCYDEHKI